MEVALVNTDGLPDGSVVSVRFGGVRRQAPLDKMKTSTLKFPSTTDNCADPLKIEVLQTIATARLVLQRKEADYQINLGGKGKTEVNVGVQVRHCPAVASESPANFRPVLPVKYQDAAVSAREYLETHGILRYIQGLLHTIIQLRPEDPFSFMIEQLAAVLPSKPGAPPARTPSEADRQEKSVDVAIPEGAPPQTKEAWTEAPPETLPQEVIGFEAAPLPASPQAAPPPNDDDDVLLPPSLPSLPPDAPAGPPPNLPMESQKDETNGRTLVKSQTVAVMSEGPKTKLSPSELQKKAKASLLKATESGALDGALSDIRQARKSGGLAAADQESLDELRDRAKSLLVNAQEEGKLNLALGKARQTTAAAKDERLQQLKLQAQSLFQAASEDGRLAAALQAGESNSEALRLTQMRQKAEAVLKGASEDGRLAVALQDISAPPDGRVEAPPQTDEEKLAVEAMKAHVQLTLVSASIDGRLSAALEDTVEDAVELQNALANALRTASNDGRLDAALENLGKRRAERAEVAYPDGAPVPPPVLSSAPPPVPDQPPPPLQAETSANKAEPDCEPSPSQQQSRQATDEAEQEEFESVPARLANALDISLSSGELASAISTVVPDDPTPDMQATATEESPPVPAARGEAPDVAGETSEAAKSVPQEQEATTLPTAMPASPASPLAAVPAGIVEVSRPGSSSSSTSQAVTRVHMIHPHNAEDIKQIHAAIADLRNENVWLKDQLGGMHKELEFLKKENDVLSGSPSPSPSPSPKKK